MDGMDTIGHHRDHIGFRVVRNVALTKRALEERRGEAREYQVEKQRNLPPETVTFRF